VAEQVGEQLELARRQPYLAAVALDAARAQVEPEVAPSSTAPRAACCVLLRRCARTRASSSSNENGLVT
jgi:hypothetical protein